MAINSINAGVCMKQESDIVWLQSASKNKIGKKNQKIYSITLKKGKKMKENQQTNAKNMFLTNSSRQSFFLYLFISKQIFRVKSRSSLSIEKNNKKKKKTKKNKTIANFYFEALCNIWKKIQYRCRFMLAHSDAFIIIVVVVVVVIPFRCVLFFRRPILTAMVAVMDRIACSFYSSACGWPISERNKRLNDFISSKTMETF